MRDLVPSEPVCHVSFYEADAYARWSGARLPTEAEWEVVAADGPHGGGNFLEDERFHPAPWFPAPETGPARPGQLFGDVWEWTQSPYTPYPRYPAAAACARREYNGKFMCNQQVLRGGLVGDEPRSHICASTYRNFFRSDARWQFSGIPAGEGRVNRRSVPTRWLE